MVILYSHFIGCAYASLDCLFGAPINACQTTLAPVLPYRPVINHFNITHGTYSCTNSAAIAVLLW